MSDKIKLTAFAIIVAAFTMIAFMGLGGMLGYQMAMGKCQFMQPDTIVVHKIDTVTLVESRHDTLIRIVEKFHSVAVHEPIVKGDTMYVMLPYEYRHYSVPDTLDVWYSGIEPCIDSAKVYVHTVKETITQVQEVVKMPRLTADIGAGALYSENNVNPYLLGEVRYNARKTTFGVYGAVNHEGRWCAGGNVTYRFNILK